VHSGVIPQPSAEYPTRNLSRRAQAAEVGVFLLLIAPQFFLSAITGDRPGWSFAVAAVAIVLRDLGFVALIFLFLARNGERREDIGWTFKKGPKYIVVGTLIFPVLLYAITFVQVGLRFLGLSLQPHLPSYLQIHSPSELPLLLYLSAVNGVAEEIIFRGYLILRLTALSGRTVAVLLSSAIFAIEHLYQGTANVLTIGFVGLIYALIYVRTRSLVIPIALHCLQDLVGILAASSIR
jgi:membrane protease YdiL (CAAX protease family)